MNHTKQSPKKANTIFSLELVGNFRGYVEHICLAILFTIIDLWLTSSSLKMDSQPPKKLVLFASIKSPLNEKPFYFLLKCLFLFLRYLRLFWLCKKWLDEKTKVSKFMTSQIGILTITICILFNFSWSKSSQTMKFILLIEYKMRNIFLEKSSPNSFYKNQNWAYRWTNILKWYKFCCYMSKSSSKCPSVQVLTSCFYFT